MSAQIHYELFIRRNANVGWTLHFATEDRARSLEVAEQLLVEAKAVAVRVTKETLDPETREFRSVTVLSKGMTEMVKPKRARVEDDAPLCVAPSDLYSSHARDRINRLLDGWLKRKKVTAFELLHRPDLVEQLDASGTELQHAVQKIAIPEAQARNVGVHEVMRTFQSLVERAIERILKDGRKQVFPNITPANFAQVLTKLQDDPERSYLIGGGIARYLGAAGNWTEKVRLLLDLADAAPQVGKARGLAFYMLEQPLTEILGSRGGVSELLGEGQDLGSNLGALIRLAANDAVALVGRHDASVLRLIPVLEGEVARLAGHLASDAFMPVRTALIRRVMQELKSHRRLRPHNPDGEIEILRALAMGLTAAAGKLVNMEDVHETFVERSRTLVTADFVTLYLERYRTAVTEAQALVRLADNVTGAANKREAARWISSCVGALKFEREMRESPESPTAKLSLLADLQKAVSKAGLAEADQARCVAKIGDIGGLIESDARLTQTLARSTVPPVQRLIYLLRMASGETAPLGACADRAKVEAVRLLKAPEVRPALASQPDQFERVRSLLGAAGLAA